MSLKPVDCIYEVTNFVWSSSKPYRGQRFQCLKMLEDRENPWQGLSAMKNPFSDAKSSNVSGWFSTCSKLRKWLENGIRIIRNCSEIISKEQIRRGNTFEELWFIVWCQNWWMYRKQVGQKIRRFLFVFSPFNFYFTKIWENYTRNKS